MIVGYSKEALSKAIRNADHTRLGDLLDELDYVYSKAISLDRAVKHIATERWNLAEDLIGEDDEVVRRQLLAELAVLQRITDVMEEESE